MDNDIEYPVSRAKEDICKSNREIKKKRRLKSKRRDFLKKKGSRSKRNIRTGDINAKALIDYAARPEAMLFVKKPNKRKEPYEPIGYTKT